MKMTEIELKNVESSDPLMRSLTAVPANETETETIETDYGPVQVVRLGAPPRSGKPYIVTYHDIGLNFHSNFQAFFNFHEMNLLSHSFTVLSVHAPGQEERAVPLPDDYRFPTMDQLAEQVDSVCKYYGVPSFVGLGVGAGANVLSRYALANPEMVDGLFLIHPTAAAASWTEWFYQKMNIYYLYAAAASGASFPQSVQDYLIWHHFGNVATEDRNRDLIETFREYFSGRHHNARNLAMFIDSYVRRTDLGMQRGTKTGNFQCTVLVLCGALSPHVDDTVEMNGRLNPETSTWMKLQDCAMVLEEQPHKVAEAFRLFLQGFGYALTAYEQRRRSLKPNEHSGTGGDVQMMHIVENPIAHC